jgi:PAS domain-containing protein
LADVSGRRRAEEALRQSETELRALFAAMSEVVLVLGRDGKYLRVAPTRPDLLVAPPPDLVGKTLGEVAPTLAQEGMRVIEQVLAERAAHTFEYSLAIGGVGVWFEASVAPLSEDSVLWVARDVSSQKREAQRREAARRGLRAVLEAADELLAAPDADTVLRRGAELGREKLGLDRTAIFLIEPGGRFVRGAYGTDANGRTTDERERRLSYPEGQSWRSHFAPVPEGQRWTILRDANLKSWDGSQSVNVGRGDIGVALIQSPSGVLGSFHCDNLFSGRPIDPEHQELVAVYCSVMGAILQNKRGEEALRAARDELEARVRTRTSELVRANTALQAEVAERERAQAQEAALSQSLRAVLLCADELLPAPDLDVLLRRAVELGRERLGLDRCAIFLLTPDNEYLQGTYGINSDGSVVGQWDNFPSTAFWHETAVGRASERWFEMGDGQSQPHYDWRDGQVVPTGASGWQVVTPIRAASGPIGLLFNDSAISGAPLDPGRQDAVVLYASLLGSIIERKKAEAALSQSEKRFRGLTETLPQIVWTATPEGEINYVNRVGMEFAGKQISTFAEWDWIASVHPDDRARRRRRGSARCAAAWPSPPRCACAIPRASSAGISRVGCRCMTKAAPWRSGSAARPTSTTRRRPRPHCAATAMNSKPWSPRARASCAAPTRICRPRSRNARPPSPRCGAPKSASAPS